jgi:hypothetical protein
MANPGRHPSENQTSRLEPHSDTMAIPGVYEACGLAFHVPGTGFDDIR